MSNGGNAALERDLSSPRSPGEAPLSSIMACEESTNAFPAA